MSYCRFSSMNWMCDVYVYEDVDGGWTTHVARRRKIIAPIPDVLASKFAMTIHKWSECYYDKSKKEMQYPKKWKEIVVNVWNKFAIFWHKYLHNKSFDLIPSRLIGLKFDGATFNDPDPQKCAKTLEALRYVGYNVPQSAIDALKSEVVAE